MKELLRVSIPAGTAVGTAAAVGTFGTVTCIFCRGLTPAGTVTMNGLSGPGGRRTPSRANVPRKKNWRR